MGSYFEQLHARKVSLHARYSFQHKPGQGAVRRDTIARPRQGTHVVIATFRKAQSELATHQQKAPDLDPGMAP